MMAAATQPTPYPDVNAALAELVSAMQVALDAKLAGVYLSGSLALGDFDPYSSDIDLVVVTETPLTEPKLAALWDVHARFDASDSPWAAKVEAVYVDREGLRRPFPNNIQYPQVEKESGLFLAPLEDGWLSQVYIVRERGVSLFGPDPKTLFDPVDPDLMRRTVMRIAEMWQREAHSDPTWIEWLRTRHNQAFITLTLCRLLYTLEFGAVASKPAVARWAQGALPSRWRALIEAAPAGQHDDSTITDNEVVETVALINYTLQRFATINKIDR